MTNIVENLYMNGVINSNHPCFPTFNKYMNLGIKNGVLKYNSSKQIVVSGLLDDPRDPRFKCLRAARVPLTTGNVAYITRSSAPRIEGFQLEMPAGENNCVYKYQYNGQDQYGNCMYSSDGKLICLKKSCLN